LPPLNDLSLALDCLAIPRGLAFIEKGHRQVEFGRVSFGPNRGGLLGLFPTEREVKVGCAPQCGLAGFPPPR
jgi:hypothetical protein